MHDKINFLYVSASSDFYYFRYNNLWSCHRCCKIVLALSQGLRTFLKVADVNIFCSHFKERDIFVALIKTEANLPFPNNLNKIIRESLKTLNFH